MQNKYMYKWIVGLGCAIVLLFMTGQISAATLYVSTDGGHKSPYGRWEDAATNIASALAKSADGDEIIVSNGVHYCRNAYIDKEVTMRSLNGFKVTFIDNSQSWGLYSRAAATLDGFTVVNGHNANSSSMLLTAGSTVQNCIFSNNWAKDGGALSLSEDSVVSNCLFVNNYSTRQGGAINVKNGQNSKIYDTVFAYNETEGHGGAIMVESSGGVKCRNLLVYSNSAAFSGKTGGGIYGTESTFLENCTIVKNYSHAHGGGVYSALGAANCIIYDNSNAGGSAWVNWSSSANFTNCCIAAQSSPAVTGVGNFTDAPLFMAPESGDFRLQEGSPCVDYGVYASWMDEAVDLDGHRRLDRFTRKVDLGAYEYVYSGSLFMLK